MKPYASILLVVGLALGMSSGCQQQEAVAIDGESWEFYDHGDPRVTLNRWARVGLNDEDEVYYVDFLAEELVTDENLFIIRDLVHLRHLDLRGTRVSDYGLPMLRGLKELRVLRLPDGVTDNGLYNLQTIAGDTMQMISISPESGVTSIGVAQLKAWFPKAKIHFQEIFRL